jgi:hypothetical protein
MGERIPRELGAALARVVGGRHGDLFQRDYARLLDAMVALAEHRPDS